MRMMEGRRGVVGWKGRKQKGFTGRNFNYLIYDFDPNRKNVVLEDKRKLFPVGMGVVRWSSGARNLINTKTKYLSSFYSRRARRKFTDIL